MTIYCLADLFNLRLWPPGRRPNLGDIRDGIGELVDELLGATTDAGEMTIRLYGGWHGPTLPFSRDLPRMVTRAIRHLPKRVGRRRLRLQLADHPIWNSSIRMLASVRESRLTRVRAQVQNPRKCRETDTCTLAALRSWFDGRCPDSACSVQLADIACQSRQKMVDTLLTADAMTIINEDLADTVILASDDDDMLPALLALAASDIRLIHLRREHGGPSRATDYYRRILSHEGATTLRW